MVSFDEYRIMSKNAYINQGEMPDLEYKTALTSGLSSTWDVLPIQGKLLTNSLDGGFDGVAYWNSSTKELVIAYRGTKEPIDGIHDAWIVADQRPPQIDFATQFYRDVALEASLLTNYDPNLKISITGHSLGGALAQLVASDQNQKAVTFNAPGMFDCAGSYVNNITNYVIMNDYVGNLRAHAGETYYIAPRPIQNDALNYDTHSSILDYNAEQFGPFISKTQLPGFGTKEAWALWAYDINNEIMGAAFKIAQQVNESDLQNAINTLENLHQYIKNTLRYRTDNGDIIIGTDKSESSAILKGTDPVMSGVNGHTGEILYSDGGNDTIYGNGGDDIINGLGGNDTIYGDYQNACAVDEGNDIIDGGTGDDQLYGGSGNDTYKYKTGNGNDTITDSDGKGQIIYDNMLLKGGKGSASLGVYKDSQGNTYVKTNEDLVINGKITVKDFKDGDLGIKLNWLPALLDSTTGKLLDSIRNSFNLGKQTISPLIIDLDGDGIETISKESGVHFDHDSNDFAENTGWIKSDDGLLVLDRNGNGVIDSGKELFGDNTILTTGLTAAGGFEALKDLDSNNDGLIDINDQIFEDLKVWKDENQDGYSSFDEIHSLSEYNIQQINLNYTKTSIDDGLGNIKTQLGSLIKTDGSVAEISDVRFEVDNMNTISTEFVEESEEMQDLPDIRGYGNVANLQQAMAKDSTNSLKSLILQFISETDSTKRHALTENILSKWTNSENYNPYGGSGYLSPRKLHVLESFMGEEFRNQNNFVGPNATSFLAPAYDTLHKYIYSQLMAQTQLKPLFEKITVEGVGKLSYNLNNVIAEINTQIDLDPTTGKELLKEFSSSVYGLGIKDTINFQSLYDSFSTKGEEYKQIIDSSSIIDATVITVLNGVVGEFNEYIEGDSNNNLIYGYGGNDTIYGRDGNDFISGGDGNDIIDGGSADDVIDGGIGNDTIYGNQGNDYLDGGIGNDTYYFNIGDGQDVINDSASGNGNTNLENIDVIKFGTGITKDDVDFTRTDINLIVKIKNSSDQITVLSQFDPSMYFKIERFDFVDGTSISFEEINTLLVPDIKGSEENDYLVGSNVSDKIYGYAGNDTLLGGEGNDTLLGGAAEDFISGGAGDDTYIFNIGDGNDVILDENSKYYWNSGGNNDNIKFGAGITKNNIVFKGLGNDLIINFKDADGNLTTDKLTIKNGFIDINKIENLIFADGDSLNYSQVLELIPGIEGTAGNDNLIGSVLNDKINGYAGNDTILSGDGDDTISGGLGNDFINGGGGNDTYIFKVGDGQDTISETIAWSKNDTLKFENISVNDVTFKALGNNIIAEIKNSTDKITLKNQNDFNSLIERFQFTDATLGFDDIISRLEAIQGTDEDDNIEGSPWAEIIEGGAGNDTINGEGGKDTISGGLGNDVIYSGAVDSTYVFRAGDGQDTIFKTYGGKSNDTLKFENISINDVNFKAVGSDIIAEIKNSADKVTLKNQNYLNYHIENFQFSDTILGFNDVISKIETQIQGTDGNDSIQGSYFSETIEGGAGNDTISGNGGNDFIFGGDGNDYILGDSGNDTFVGGSGDDNIFGGGGDDTYIFRAGDGQDTVSNYSWYNNNDTLRFENISINDVTFKVVGNDIIAEIKNSTDKVTLKDQSNLNYHIENFQFADTILGFNDILSRLEVNGTDENDIIQGSSWSETIKGKDGNDTINSMAGNDTIYGGTGDDYIYGASGNKTIDGGAGNDTILGGIGDDTYIFRAGDGHDIIFDENSNPYWQNNDTLKFENISVNDVVFKAVGNDIIAEIKNSTDKVTLKNQNNVGSRIEQIQFSDAILRFDNIISKLVSKGTDGNDNILGSSWPETIEGGLGNDFISGGNGDDTYIFRAGDGQDTISEDLTSYGNDTLKFEDISVNDVTFKAVGNDIIAEIKNSIDKVTLKNQNDFNSRVENYQFSDTILGFDNIISKLVSKGTDGNDNILGSSWSETIEGGLGNDSISGGDGNDTYIFRVGDGQDTISDNSNLPMANNDTLKFDGISVNDVNFKAVGNDIIAEIKNTTDKITLKNQNNLNSRIESFQFSDAILGFNNVISKIGTEIQGTEGNDNIEGSPWADTILGGAGNDTINGGDGNDTYIFRAGDGQDIIIESKDLMLQNNDTLKFENISVNDVIFKAVGNDIIAEIKNSTDKVTLKNQNNFASRIEKFQFSDTILGINDVILRFATQRQGTDGDDSIQGSFLSETISGGLGNDFISGGEGNDIYIFKTGDGQDTISEDSNSSMINNDTLKFENISVNDVTFKAVGNDIIAEINNSSDKVILKNQNDINSRIENIQFSDAMLGINDIISTIETQIQGTDGDDSIQGSFLSETIEGGLGNDFISGGVGDDKYIFNLGDGQDTISEDSNSSMVNNDTLKFENISVNDVTFKAVGNDIIAEINNSTDKVTLKNQNDTNSRIENIQFSDASIGIYEVISKMGTQIQGTDGNDNIEGSPWADTISGGAGNDSINGGTGNDIYIFRAGDGEDTILENSSFSWDTLKFENISVNDVTFKSSGNDIIAEIKNSADKVTLKNQNDINSRIENFQFADKILGFNEVSSRLETQNTVPVSTLTAGTVDEDKTLVLDVLANSSDIDGDILSISGFTQAENGIVSLNTDNKLVYTPNSNYNGTDNFDYTISDGKGGIVTKTINLTINSINDAPIVNVNIQDQTYEVNKINTFTIPANSFTDIDGDNLVYTASLEDNSALPQWLSFDPNTGTFEINGYNSTFETLNIKITASDGALALSRIFSLNPKKIEGSSSDDNLQGTTNNDLLLGYIGNDSLNGNIGADIMFGGAGNDTYFVDDIGDIVAENLNEGTDTVNSSISYALGANIENLALSGLSAINGTGNSLDNYISGNSAANNINAGVGNDTIDGGLGSDTMVGGLGNDTYFVDNISDVVTENTDEGTDTVVSSINYSLGNNVENLTLSGLSAINGTGNSIDNYISGNSAANNINAGVGNDTIDGGLGTDIMIGGAGNDTYFVDNIGDIVTENINEGTDTVFSSINYALGNNVENLTLSGVSAINGTGNSLNNLITGNSTNNNINTGIGNDTLDGGMGADTMIGGLGNDTYFVDNIGDVVTEASVLATEIDTVNSSISYTLGANLEKLNLTGTDAVNATGNVLKNTLIGNISDNILDGGVGADTMTGGLGNDTYFVDNIGDIVTETSSLATEIDTVNSSISYTLGANLEWLTLTGAAAINGTGNSLNNLINGNTSANVLNGGIGSDTMVGGLGNDTYVVDNIGDVVTETSVLATEIDTVNSSITYSLGANVENLTLTGTDAVNATGNALNNLLTGNTSDNILDGGVGADKMTGGLGNDTYFVDNVGDVVTETSTLATEIDTVNSSITYSLGSNVENLKLTGTDAINATGNALKNIIAGNSADNILNGGVGADTMLGGLGNDRYVVDNIGDVVTENTDEGLDTVNSSISYTLGANIENLTLTGAAVVNATGNELNNLLAGNAAANILNGGLGSDTMVGGLGNDTYVVDNIGDVVTETSTLATEIDTVNSSISYTLGANVENLNLAGTDAVNATGNALINILIGNTADNILDGGVGADKMTGGLGNDTYVVDNIGDVVTETSSLATEIDTVNSSINYTLGSNVEWLTLTGTAAINGTGNTLNNFINGNAADNILNGGIGTDTMIGGIGNDIYFVDNIGDIVTENANEGLDTVNSSISYTLGANVENLTLTGAAVVNATGNELNNLINGNTAANALDGGMGNDILNGGAGNDTYLFSIGSGIDNVTDTTGVDLIKFDTSVNKAKIALFKDSSGSLIIDYGTEKGTEKITINSWNTVNNQIEKVQLGDGQYMSNVDINKLIQDMAAYSTQNGIQITSVDTVKNDQNLMNLVSAGWHS